MRASTLRLPTERSLASSIWPRGARSSTREAARLFAERGYHGTSMGDLAEAIGVQKGSLYSLTGSKQELLVRDDARGRARVPRRARRACPRTPPAVERIRARAARRTSRVVAEQLDVATVFTREWRYLEGEHRERVRRRAAPLRGALARRSSARAVERGELRTDLDVGAAALLVLSAANWAYTWLRPGRDTDALADRFFAILVDGMRGYATRPA